MSEEDPLYKLTEDHKFVRSMVFFQRAQVEALQQFVAAQIADLVGIERGEMVKELKRLTWKRYDEIILKVGDRYPAVADEVDIRKFLPPEERDRWLFPE